MTASNAFKVLHDCLTNVLLNVGDLDNAITKRAGAVEIAVHANHIISFPQEA